MGVTFMDTIFTNYMKLLSEPKEVAYSINVVKGCSGLPPITADGDVFGKRTVGPQHKNS